MKAQDLINDDPNQRTGAGWIGGAAPPPPDEAEVAAKWAEYTKALNAPRPRHGTINPRAFRPLMPYHVPDEGGASARALVLAQFNLLADYRAVQLNEPEFKFTFDGNSGQVIRDLIKHAINDPTGGLPLNKGWWLWSDVGVGKTTIVKALQGFLATVNSDKQFRLTDTPSMYDDLVRNPGTFNFQHLVEHDRVFDDAGFKMEPVNVYGNKVNPLEYLLWKRHLRWEGSGQLTYFTSNIPLPMFLDRLDPRLASRVSDMVVEVKLCGGSKRR